MSSVSPLASEDQNRNWFWIQVSLISCSWSNLARRRLKISSHWQIDVSSRDLLRFSLPLSVSPLLVIFNKLSSLNQHCQMPDCDPIMRITFQLEHWRSFRKKIFIKICFSVCLSLCYDSFSLLLWNAFGFRALRWAVLSVLRLTFFKMTLTSQRVSIRTDRLDGDQFA